MQVLNIGICVNMQHQHGLWFLCATAMLYSASGMIVVCLSVIDVL